jgi:hypothetical protein
VFSIAAGVHALPELGDTSADTLRPTTKHRTVLEFPIADEDVVMSLPRLTHCTENCAGTCTPCTQPQAPSDPQSQRATMPDCRDAICHWQLYLKDNDSVPLGYICSRVTVLHTTVSKHMLWCAGMAAHQHPATVKAHALAYCQLTNIPPIKPPPTPCMIQAQSAACLAQAHLPNGAP